MVRSLVAICIACCAIAPAHALTLQCVGQVAGMADGGRAERGPRRGSGEDAQPGGAARPPAARQFTIEMEVDSSAARLRMPRDLLPALNSATNGWLDVRDLVITDRTISGAYRASYAVDQRFEIDRVSGMFRTIDNANIFRTRRALEAQCGVVDTNSRRF